MGIKLTELRRAGVKLPCADTAATAPAKRNRPRGTGAAAMRKKLMLSLRPGVTTRPGYLRAVIPVRTQTEKNSSEPFWVKRKRAQLQARALASIVRKFDLPPLPATVRFTRYSKGKPLDSDNATGSCCYLRDQLARMYGVDDAPTSPLQFDVVVPHIGCGDFFVVIEIISLAGGEGEAGK
jgi:hypothetical protein